MLVPVKWLKDYIDIDDDSRTIADKVTDTGSHVEAIQNMGEGISNIKVGQILNLRQHDTLNKLSIVDLDLGDSKVTLITGAKNMKVGDKVIAALLGAHLPGGMVIGEADFGGIKSPGMLCSYEELAIAENTIPKNSKDGIIILSDDAVVGEEGLSALGLNDEVIEFEITPNRPDCLSIIGMAREVAAAFDTKVQLPQDEILNEDGHISDLFKGLDVQTENSQRFLLRAIKDVKIKESPQYIKNYLIKAGMRPINNIVDLTNFIMLEYGQPLHAYDLDMIKGNAMIVRMAKEGEIVKTLDKSERKLLANDIVICDGNSEPIGLAGVMGGFDTEVTDNTKNILIEAATFTDENIRQTSKRLNLRSEASSRYEKGISVELPQVALQRFLHLVEKIGAGTVVEGIYDHGKKQSANREVKLRNSRSNMLLGLDLSVEQTQKYLESLDLEVTRDGDELTVNVPYFREDLTIEADLIEEVGRLYGFHNIKPQPLKGQLTEGLKSDKREFIDQLRLDIYALGFSEILTYSFISEKVYDKLNVEADNKLRDVIKIMNPLGEDFSVMRTTLIGNMLDVVRKNLNNKASDLRLSEVGNTFQKEDGKIVEHSLMTLGLVGDYDFYYLKDVVLKLFAKNKIENYRFVKNTNNSIYHNGRCGDIYVDDQLVGVMGEIHPLVMDNFDISKRVYICEINVDKIMKHVGANRYEKVSRYPMIERDIALVVDKDVESQAIIDVIVDNGGDNLKEVQLFDIYTGSQIEENKKSLAYKIGFQSDERTLKDQEVKDAFDAILDKLSDAFGVNLRG
ncbi:MAG: phenylalanine--tRNA ligase subunit beta [Tissierellia bacterium]|nr:phenylalanine--tRNA ligase subunit beta [Tissierellia bacterium]